MMPQDHMWWDSTDFHLEKQSFAMDQLIPPALALQLQSVSIMTGLATLGLKKDG